MLEDWKKLCRLAKEKQQQAAAHQQEQQELLQQQQQTNENVAHVLGSEKSPAGIMRAKLNDASGLATTGGGTFSVASTMNDTSCLAMPGGGSLSIALESTMTTGMSGDTTSMADTSMEEYWEIGFASKAANKKLFLQLFKPTSGVLSKNKE
jgi:hypothetical protein